MRGRLSETQYEKLHDVLYVKRQDTQIREIVGKSEQLERNKALKNLLPRFSWDKYFLEGFSEIDTADKLDL